MLDVIKRCIFRLLPLTSTGSSPISKPEPGAKDLFNTVAQPTLVKYPQDDNQVAMVTAAAMPTTPWIAKRQLNSLAGYTLRDGTYVAFYCSSTAQLQTSLTYAGCCAGTACNKATACSGSVVSYAGGNTSLCPSNLCMKHTWQYTLGGPAYIIYGCNTAFGDLIYVKPTVPVVSPGPTTVTVPTTIPTTSTVKSTSTITNPTTINNPPTPNTPPADTPQPSTITIITSRTSYTTNAAGSTSTAIVVYTTASVALLGSTNAGETENTVPARKANTPAIIGGAVGGGVGVLAIAAAGFLLCCFARKRKANRASVESDTPSTIYVTPQAKPPALPYPSPPSQNFYQPPSQPGYAPQPAPTRYYEGQNAGGYGYSGNNQPPAQGYQHGNVSPPQGYQAYTRTPSELSSGSSPRVSGYAPPLPYGAAYSGGVQEMSAVGSPPPQTWRR